MTHTRLFRRAVVTGGAGFVGSHLCEALIGAGCEVVCVDNLCTGSMSNIAQLLETPGFSLLRGDAAEPFEVPGPVDLVLHLASPASPVDYLRLPIETLDAGSTATRRCLDLARTKGARFLLASTSEVYGDPLQHPQRESYWGNVNPVGPRAVYDEAKRFAEALTTAYRAHRGTDTVIVRLFNTYGPRMRPDDGRAVPAFITQSLAGAPVTVAGDGRQTRSLCHVSDTVRGILAAAHSRHPGPLNLGNPDEITILDLAEKIRVLCGSRSDITFVARPVDDPSLRRPDIALAETVLSWRPRIDADTGLADTIGWFRSRLAERGGHSSGKTYAQRCASSTTSGQGVKSV